jgi:hypothetical protein
MAGVVDGKPRVAGPMQSMRESEEFIRIPRAVFDVRLDCCKVTGGRL